MALSNPLTAAEFTELYRVRESVLVQGFQQEASMSGGGDQKYADRAPSLWMGKISTVPMTFADSAGVMALINSRGGGLKQVLIHDSRVPYPSSDPDGSVLTGSGATPTIKTITNRLHIIIEGLPAAYPLPRGTRFGVIFDTSRYYLGEFAEPGVADETGETASLEISPPLPASVVTDLAVNLLKPPAKCTITPGTAFPSTIDSLHEAIDFSVEQTYRA